MRRLSLPASPDKGSARPPMAGAARRHYGSGMKKRTAPTRPGHATALLAAFALAAGALSAMPLAQAEEGGAAALQARFASLQPALQHSAFGRPLVLEANDSEEAPRGDVYALLDHPIGQVVEALRSPSAWCEVMLLQTNVKRCAVEGGKVQVGMTRKYTDTPDTATTMGFQWHLRDASPQHLDVSLSAPEGLLGTSDYRLSFEAVPAGEGRSFVHLSYAYRMGTAARVATSMYLSTSGKDKVGFSVAGRDEQGRPRYVGGMRGVAERNTMRTFLAIDSTVATQDTPPAQRLARRQRTFHDSLERYPAQLHETELGEYLALKKRDAVG